MSVRQDVLQLIRLRALPPLVRVGRGAEVFDDRREEFTWAREQLAVLLSPAEYAAARRNTPERALHRRRTRAADMEGGQGARLRTRPGAGTWLRQRQLHRVRPSCAQVTGIELDPLTAGIAALLHPGAEIRAGSFADSPDADGSFDLAIGNVPFGNMMLRDRRHSPARHSIHNHFIVKALHLVRPGGLAVVLTSRFGPRRAVTAKNAWASMDKVTCQCQAW